MPSHATLVLSPSGDLPEVLPDFAFGAGDELTVRAYVELIRKAKNDSRIDGILLRPGGINSPFWAKLQELREAHRRLQDQRQVRLRVARVRRRSRVLPRDGGRQDLPAAVGDARSDRRRQLRSVPARDLRLDRHLSRTSCTSAITRPRSTPTSKRRFTPAHKEMSESLNRSQYDQLVDDDCRRRAARARRRCATLIDQGPFQPVDALRVGLIDEVAYEDELDDLVPELKGARLHRRRGLRRGVVGADRRAAPLEDRGDQCVRRDQFRQQRLRSGQRRGRRIGFARRVHPRRARRRFHQGDRAARRQPRRIVDGVGRDLARAVDFAREPSARDRVDVGPGGLGRLLHRAGRRRDRRAARHADRIDRRLHRQVRDQRLAREARREHRGDERRQARRDLFARSPIHAGRARRRSRNRCRSSTTSSSSGPPPRGT